MMLSLSDISGLVVGNMKTHDTAIAGHENMALLYHHGQYDMAQHYCKELKTLRS